MSMRDELFSDDEANRMLKRAAQLQFREEIDAGQLPQRDVSADQIREIGADAGIPSEIVETVIEDHLRTRRPRFSRLSQIVLGESKVSVGRKVNGASLSSESIPEFTGFLNGAVGQITAASVNGSAVVCVCVSGGTRLTVEAHPSGSGIALKVTAAELLAARASSNYILPFSLAIVAALCVGRALGIGELGPAIALLMLSLIVAYCAARVSMAARLKRIKLAVADCLNQAVEWFESSRETPRN